MNNVPRPFLFFAFLLCSLLPFSVFSQDSFNVTSSDDSGAWDDPDTEDIDETSDGICDDGTGHCTLRAAIEEASNRGNAVIINFGVAGTIHTSGDLGYLNDGSYVLGPDKNITIVSSGDLFNGGDNITISNLILKSNAVSVNLGSNCIIKGNHILSGQVGISVTDQNVIGGASVADRNVIGGCLLGIAVGGSYNYIAGNYIGVNAGGIIAIPNQVGIIIANSGNVIGGSTPAERNIISGNSSQGIGAAGMNNIIKGNYIGLGADGISGVPNGIGVKMDGIGIIGGDTPAERNIISANNNGVSLGVDPDGNSGVILKGNFIGTDVSGTIAKGNTGAGVTIASAGHRIESNVISSNGTAGIGILSVSGASLSTDNVISGNKIGTDITGLNPLPNEAGIIFQGPSENNIVGEGMLTPYDGNIIAFNQGPGIFVDNQQAFGGIPEGNTFRKNSIFQNGDLGILIRTGAQGSILPPVLDSLKDGTLYGHGAVTGARIDVYESDPDPSGAGEGKTWLAEGNAAGDGTFRIPVSNPNCNQLTVTQTDPNRNTSQFSQNLELDPIVKSLNPSCEQIFLVGVVTVNTYTATLDWKGAPEAGRQVTFELNGEIHQGALSGDIATTSFNMGNIAAGNNTMTIKASSCGGSSPDFTYTVCGTTVPEWAGPSGTIIATGASCNVSYNKVITFPDPSIVPYMPVMSDIPFIGGALGFLSTQGKVSLSASSAGGTLTNTDVALDTDFSLGGEKFNLSVSGTTNTTLNCNSLNLDGSLTATVSVSHTYSWGTDLSSLLPVTCPSIPLLGEICQSARAVSGLASLGAEVGGSLGLTANYTAGNGVQFTSGSGTGTVFVRPFINVFPFSAEGRGTLSMQVNIPSFDTHGQLQLQFSASAGPFGSKSFGPYNWSANAKLSGENNFDVLKNINLHQLKDPESSNGQDTLIIPGIPADADPVLIVGPNGRRAVTWSHFHSNRARPSGDIGVKLYNGAVWTSAIFLNTDIQVDQKPVAAFDNAGHVIVCWERNTSSTIPAIDAIWTDTYFQGFNIQYAVLETNSGSVQSTGTFGNPGIYDFSPSLSKGIDGSVLLVWESTSGNTIYGNASDPASLYSARWNGSSWGTPVIINSSLKGIHSWEAANRNNTNSMVTMIMDTDNNLSTHNDWEVYSDTWDGTRWTLTRLTNNVVYDWGAHGIYAEDGSPVISWLRESTVMGVIGNVTQAPSVWLNQSNNVGLEFIHAKLASGGGKLMLSWPELGNISTSSADLALPVWSSRISASTEKEERSLSLALDEGGNRIYGYLSVPFSATGFTLSDTADFYITPPKTGPVITGINEEIQNSQDSQKLMDAFPNPFDHTTRISFSLDQNSFVILKILDIQGNAVKTLVNENRVAGFYEEVFNSGNLSPGTYLFRLQTKNSTETKRMIILK